MRATCYFCILALTITHCFGGNRIWTDKTGREIEAEFVSATKYKVKIRRKSDQRVFEVPITSLSRKDQNFILAEVNKDQVDPFTVNTNGTPHAPPTKDPSQPISLGKGIVPDRSKIPSLSEEELGNGYPSGPSNLVNILVWWGDTIAPESMPHNKRERSIERIANDIESYFRDDSNSTKRIREGMMRYSEHKLDGYAIRYIYQRHAPSIDELSKLMNKWYGIVALCGIYEENSSGELSRLSGRYTTLADVQGKTTIHNLMGRQYFLLMSDEVVGIDRFPSSWTRRMIEGTDRKGYLQVANPSLVPGNLFPKDKIILLEMILSFEIYKLPEVVD